MELMKLQSVEGVIVMAMLIIVTQLWNHTDVCASRKATQKEIIVITVCHCTTTSLFIRVTKFMPIIANLANVMAMQKAATMT